MIFRNVLALTQLCTVLMLGGCAQSVSSPPSAAPVPLEPLGQVLPSNSSRAGWIDQIIAQDPVVISLHKPVLQPASDNDARIAKLRKQDGGVLPEGYWALYKQNLEAMQYDLNHQHDVARAEYVNTYRDELSRLSDVTLQTIATAPQALDAHTRRQLSTRLSDRSAAYITTSNQSFRAATDAHINRMALMDRQYDVCTRQPDCWDAPVKH